MNGMKSISGQRRRVKPWRAAGAGVLVLTVCVAGCDTRELVDLHDPDLITLPVVEDTSNIESVRNGALFEFGRALTGLPGTNQTPGLIGISGLFSDELWYASTRGAMKDIDERDHLDINPRVRTVYGWLHRARNLAEQAEALYADSRPGSAERAFLINMNAYTYLLFAETFCSGVPFSRAPLGQPLEYAPGITTTETLHEAVARFDQAMSLAAGDAAYQNLARIGKARALQNLGDFTGAASAVAGIPDDFEFLVTYSSSTTGQNNGVWYNINSERRTSAATNEGVNGLAFFARGPSGSNIIDPRIGVDSTGLGLGTAVPHYLQLKYDTRGADVVLASGVEARLIEAEANLNRGTTPGSSDPGNWLHIINELRAALAMTALTDPGSADDRMLMLYEERAKWLWLTAHRMGDLRRLVREYGFAQGDIYPIGQTIEGSPRGTDVVFIIPQAEDNNPEYSGDCMSLDA